MDRFYRLLGFAFVLLLAPFCFGKVLSTTEECSDALGRECFRYKDEDCVGVYETWARANCSLRCGYCPQKLPCVDNINYCSQFGADVCNQEVYGQYMRENCRKTCNFCRVPTEYLVSSTTSTTTPVPTTTSTTVNPAAQWCKDKTSCWYYPDEKCTGLYEDWARKNCPFRCGYCPDYLPPCEDLDPSCDGFPLAACTNLTYRAYMKENCRKRCNECKYPGEHLIKNTPPYPITTRPTKKVLSTAMAVPTKPLVIETTLTLMVPSKPHGSGSVTEDHTTSENIFSEFLSLPSETTRLQASKTNSITVSGFVTISGNSHNLLSGQNFAGLCRVSGLHTAAEIYQKYTVEWLFNEKRISIFGTTFDHKYSISSHFTNGIEEYSLSVAGVTKADSGNYTCSVTVNSHGTVIQKTWNLYVDYMVSVSGNSHLLQKSEVFNVSCRITGYQQAFDVYDMSTVEWLFNGQRISYFGMVLNANKYRLHVKATNMYLEFGLEIPGVTAGDTGNYTCVLGDRVHRKHFQQKSWHLHVICMDCSQNIVG